MTTPDQTKPNRPTGTFKVLYDDPATLAEHIDALVDTDVLELRDLALNLLHDLEEARKVITVAYERLDHATGATR